MAKPFRAVMHDPLTALAKFFRWVGMLFTCALVNVIAQAEEGTLSDPWEINTEVIAVAEPNSIPQATLYELANRDEQRSRTNDSQSAPELRVRISTPNRYLSGFRDDYDHVWSGSLYSEYAFSISGESLDTLVIGDAENTDLFEKPFREAYGLQVSRVHRASLLENQLSWSRKSTAEYSYGLRYLSLNEAFFVRARGGFFGSLWSQMLVNNDLMGPQMAFRWSEDILGCELGLNAFLMTGYNFVEASQSTNLGISPFQIGLNPGGTMRQRVWSAEHDQEDFAAVGELRAHMKYPVTDNVAIQLGYVGVYFSQLHRSEDAFSWTLPLSGLSGGLEQDTPDTWVDQIHASIEWRR